MLSWVRRSTAAAPVLVTGLVVGLATSGCAGSAVPTASGATPASAASPSVGASLAGSPDPKRVAPQFRHPLPGMPPVLDGDVYAAARAGDVQARIAHDAAYLYVPNSKGDPITTVIDQRTHRIVRILHTGTLSQHVTPSYDLRTLYVEASVSNQLVALDPKNGRITGTVPETRPYNLYFTPDGKHALEVAEQDSELFVEDAHTFAHQAVISDPSCVGPNHLDFSANGRYFVLSCEFSHSLLKVSTVTDKVLARMILPADSKPQDVRLAPDGTVFYVADMGRNKLLRIGWRGFRVVGSTDTPSMPHGIYPSRDGRYMYVSDRGAGKVSVVSVRTNKIVDTWAVPGGTPDMGGVSADGTVLWLSGRYSGEVYGIDTRTGKLIARIHVGGYPHGILVWPQPGRYSLGHTGDGSMR